MELVSRSELVQIAKQEGVDISERTLRYWSQRGLIPKPQIVKRKACYPANLIERLKRINLLRARTLEDIGKKLDWASDHFDYILEQGNDIVILRAKPHRKEKGESDNG